MMLMLSVLACVPACLPASACMSAHPVRGWPMEPHLLAASGWCTHRFHGREQESQRTALSMRVCVCVRDACAVKLTGAGCPGFMHASQPSRSLALHIFSVYLCACCMVTWWRFSTSDSASAVKCVFTWASVTVDEQQDYTALHHHVTTFCCLVIHFLSGTTNAHTLTCTTHSNLGNSWMDLIPFS